MSGHFIEFRVRVEELTTGWLATCDDGHGGEFASAQAPTAHQALDMLVPYMHSVAEPARFGMTLIDLTKATGS